MTSYRPRLSIEISDEQNLRKQRLIPVHGLQKALFSNILDDLLDLIEEQGQVVVGLILNGSVKAREVIPCMKGDKK
jgi:hypothetical protein